MEFSQVFRRLILCGFLLLAVPSQAAPLFPDVPENHWARDAVATLAARGIVEGYPDGTFKGDRAASRWEVAMMVARLLARMEQEHATFATRAELEEVRKLVAALREELDALGVRVTNLEDATARLDQRVDELERITYYGSFEARLVSQAFTNRGAADNDNGRRGAGAPAGVPYVNYNTLVGSGAAATMRPQTHAVIPVVDYVRGRDLNNGTGFTARAILGLKIKVSPEIDSGAEFSAYTSQGDRFVDGYWGVYPPYLSSPVTANGVGSALYSAQPLNNTPFTRMTLDNFWVRHNPSKTRLLLGAIDKLLIDPLVFAGQPNLGVYGPARIPGFGFQVTGETPLATDSLLRWEAVGSRLGSGNLFGGLNYQHTAVAADLAWEFKGGMLKGNFARIFDEQPPGGPQLMGLQTTTNVPYGASAGWNVTQWVNPPGWFAAQRPQSEQAATAAVPNTADTRPISGWNGAADNAIGLGPAGGNFGPQGLDTYGLHGRYEWKLDDETAVRARAEWATSSYRSNRNSSYTADGDALRGEVGASLLKGDVDVSAFYLSIDPTYNPLLYSGNMLGVRFPRPWAFAGRFHMHDFNAYPHNREGWGLAGRWKFDSGKGEVTARGQSLTQKRSSLYDVRALPGSAGVGAPNFPVLGFAPGFIDAVFSGYAHPLQYGPLSASSFTDTLQPLEDHRGTILDWTVGASYRWDDPKVRIDGSYQHLDFDRPTSLTAGFGGSQNRVNLQSDYLHFGVVWDLSEKWSLLGGYDQVSVHGHHDPAGLYNSYAVAANDVNFANVDSVQTIPSVGFQNRLTRDLSWDMTVSKYTTTDGVDVPAGRGLDTIGSTSHPFSWDGWQVQTHFLFKF